jgi:glycosyltransferase involved in cell wall biosynthesis
MKSLHSRVIGIVVNEIFGYGGFGGFGMVARTLIKLLTEIGYSVVVITVKYTGGKAVQSDVIDGCQSLVLEYWSPKNAYRAVLSSMSLAKFIITIKPDAFIFIEPIHYFHIALQVKWVTDLVSPDTKIIVNFQDPRSLEDVARILDNQLETRVEGNKHRALTQYSRGLQLIKGLLRRADGYIAQAKFIARKAEEIFELEETPVVIPNAVEVPATIEKPEPNPPTVLFLGRLDPIKRPWIFFNLAKLHSDVHFIVAGCTHFHTIMDPIINAYRNVPNLSFQGLVTGEEKSELLLSSHVLVNTSVYEALPVSFLEALAYNISLLSCQNPEGLTEKYGFYTGEIAGEGNSSEPIFSAGLQHLLKDRWFDLGRLGRKYVQEEHTFHKVKEKLGEYLNNLDI